jgi:hypothetical protein
MRRAHASACVDEIFGSDAGVAKLADAQDLKSWAPKGACGFDPRPRHPILRRSHDLALDLRGQPPAARRTDPVLSLSAQDCRDPMGRKGGEKRERKAREAEFRHGYVEPPQSNIQFARVRRPDPRARNAR